MPETRSSFFAPAFTATKDKTPALRTGFRFGKVGTHSSRTMMLEELGEVFSAVPPDGSADQYAHAIVEDNCLGKQTASNRKHSLQHLRELYGMDPRIPLFRVLASLWPLDTAGRPLLALLAALARDPLLRATASAIGVMTPGSEYQRSAMREALGRAAEERLNDSTVEKIVRNAASSWAQSGHLEGRTFKVRRVATATPVAAAFALYLADRAGFHGHETLTSAWVKLLDCGTSTAMELALEAKRMGLIDVRVSGEVMELGVGRLDPGVRNAGDGGMRETD